MGKLASEPTVVSFGQDVLERMVRAVEMVRERLLRSTAALEAAGVPYAVIGGNAVAAWVSKVDPGAAIDASRRRRADDDGCYGMECRGDERTLRLLSQDTLPCPPT